METCGMKQYKPKKNKHAKQFKLHSSKRDTRQKRGYTKEWYAYRARFLKHNPNCYVCRSTDRINLDHIVRHQGDTNLFWDIYNIAPLCHSCHSIVTGRFDRYDPPRTKEKIEWIKKQREQNNVDIKVKIVPFK